MKTYPSIPKKINDKFEIIAFDKLDGSNIRVEWNPKEGFTRFGTKTRLLGEDQGVLFKAKDLILNKYQELDTIFKNKKYKNTTCFFEFFGNKSKFGQHKSDDCHDVVLIDVAYDKRGFTSPKDFIQFYGHLGIPKVLYEGIADSDFKLKVENGDLEGISTEGVVCKGVRSGQIVMFKIKTNKWLGELKEYCGENQNLFYELA